MPALVRLGAVSIPALLILAACGGGAAPTSAPTGGGPSDPTPDRPTLDPGSEPPAEEVSFMRLANLYLDEDGAPEDIVMHVNSREDDGEPPLAQVAYGPEGSEYLPAPAERSLRIWPPTTSTTSTPSS